MFEYINPGFLMMGALILFVFFVLVVIEVGENHEKGTHKIGARATATVFIIIMLALVFWDASDTKKSLINNKADFKRGIPLECNAGFNTYLVQKSTGWQLSKESFLKDDILISLKSCEPRDKGE